jgi:hypothetical protein
MGKALPLRVLSCKSIIQEESELLKRWKCFFLSVAVQKKLPETQVIEKRKFPKNSS